MAPNKRSTHAFKNEWNGKRGKIQKSRWERGKGRIQRQRVQVPRVRRRRVAGCRFTEVEQVSLCCLTSDNFFFQAPAARKCEMGAHSEADEARGILRAHDESN